MSGEQERLRKVILLVDDDITIRKLIRELLQDEGYEVLVAADGHEALELTLAYAGTIDLLLTDVEMPHVDGISAYRQILANRELMKVLFISGCAFPAGITEMWPFLSKPFRFKDLLSMVHDIFRDAPTVVASDLPVILVVDDEQARKKRTRNILNENGYGVRTASSVEEAEAICRTAARIDLIVSEVMFWGDTGVQLAERQASERKIRTLLISHLPTNLLNTVPGFAMQEEFLANPFTSEELLLRVRNLLIASK